MVYDSSETIKFLKKKLKKLRERKNEGKYEI
jgi:hypothetical protein